MKRKASHPRKEKKPGLHRVATGLYRMEPSGKYYAQLRRQGKLIRSSLKTSDRKLAERKLKEKEEELAKLDPLKAKLSFKELTESWKAKELAARDLKPGGLRYRLLCVQGLERHWKGVSDKMVSAIGRTDCTTCYAARRPQISASLFNNEVSTLKMILDYAVREGAILDNPAKPLARIKKIEARIEIPDRKAFQRIIAHFRDRKMDGTADFLELLAYSGMRLTEAAEILWDDIDFERNTFCITGGEQGTKNRKVRHVPLFPNLKQLLERVRKRSGGKAGTRVAAIQSCHNPLMRACKRLKLPHFTHHSLRHFFCSNAIEAGIDFKVIAAWLGHSDGGILVAKTYGHLRQQHSEAMAAKMTFTAAPAKEAKAG